MCLPGRRQHNLHHNCVMSQKFLREVKEESVLKVSWVVGNKNNTNWHAQNLGGPDFERCTIVYVGKDEYKAHASESIRTEKAL